MFIWTQEGHGVGADYEDTYEIVNGWNKETLGSFQIFTTQDGDYRMAQVKVCGKEQQNKGKSSQKF